VEASQRAASQWCEIFVFCTSIFFKVAMITGSLYHFQVRICRAAYHFRCQRCEDFKDGLSLVVDGQEFSSFGLPHFNVFDKLSSQGWKLKVNHAKKYFCFICPFLPVQLSRKTTCSSQNSTVR
jgi:hypothetical protein